MKNFIISLCSILFLGCNSNSQSFTDLPAQAFKTAFEEEEGIILDVRTLQELSSGQIENASNIDFYDINFNKKIQKIQKDKTVYVYCKSGGRSSKAAQLLMKLGQAKVVNLSGGFMAWKSAGLPITTSSQTDDNFIQDLSESQFENMLIKHNLVLVDFHTLWCVPCRKISPIIDELKEEYLNSTHILRVDIDKSESLADLYSIKAVPTLVLFNNEKEVWRHTGLIEKKELKDLLDTYTSN